jgi:hypothetical protein
MLSMTESFVNTTWTIFATYVSIVFAFLITSYLVADKLVARIVWVVIALYTLVSLWALWGLNRTSVSLAASMAEIKRMVQEADSSLGWWPPASTPDFAISAIPAVITAIAVLAYIGSVVFFFHQRTIRESE